jgi:hypothetical protein
MLSRDYRDIIGGLILMVIGAGAAIMAWRYYPVGTARRMGPGMYPIGLGSILFFIGCFIFAPAFFRRGEPLPGIEWRQLGMITVSGLVFALTLNRFGIIPSVIALVLVSSFADDKLKWTSALLYGAALALGSWLIFDVALGLPVSAFKTPF